MKCRILVWVSCLSLSSLYSIEIKRSIIAGYVNEEVITKNDVYQLSKEADLNYEQALNRLIEQQLLLQDFKCCTFF